MLNHIQSLSPCAKIFAVAGGILLFSLIVHVVHKFICSTITKLSVKMFPPFFLLLFLTGAQP